MRVSMRARMGHVRCLCACTRLCTRAIKRVIIDGLSVRDHLLLEGIERSVMLVPLTVGQFFCAWLTHERHIPPIHFERVTLVRRSLQHHDHSSDMIRDSV